MTAPIYGLVGFPLEHSFSGKWFNSFFREKRSSESYRLYEIEDIGKVDGIIRKEKHLTGFNVTAPYKREIIPLLEELSPEARMIGAVNTVFIKRSPGSYSLFGHNTDKDGFMESLHGPWKGQAHALILGCGGASRAVREALKELGTQCVRACRKVQEAGDIPFSELDQSTLSNHSLIINTTPLGTYPNTSEFPPVPYEYIGKGHLVYDLVYNPSVTMFLKLSGERGAACMNGLDMLYKQAMHSYRWWQEMKEKHQTT